MANTRFNKVLGFTLGWVWEGGMGHRLSLGETHPPSHAGMPEQPTASDKAIGEIRSQVPARVVRSKTARAKAKKARGTRMKATRAKATRVKKSWRDVKSETALICFIHYRCFCLLRSPPSFLGPSYILAMTSFCMYFVTNVNAFAFVSGPLRKRFP